MYIGTSEEAYAAFMTGPPRGLESSFGIYPSLRNIQGVDGYHSRLLVLTRDERDLIRFSPSLRPVVQDLLTHLEATGTPVAAPENVIFSETFGEALIEANSGREVLTFQFDERMHTIRPDPDWYGVVCQFEHKGRLIDSWKGKVLVPPSVCVYGESQGERMPQAAEVWQQIEKKPGRIKVAFGASGNEQPTFTSLTGLRKLLKSRELQGRDIIIQQDVGDIDVSVNYYSDGSGKLYFLFGTIQENEGSKYVGNIKDETYTELCREVTDRMAVYAVEHGMKGFFGFDLRVSLKKKLAWVIECNARVTAPLYGWISAMKHDATCFGVTTIKGVQGRTIAEVIPCHFWYSKQTGRGVIFHNPGAIAAGEGQITVLGADQAEVMRLLEEAKQVAKMPAVMARLG